MDNISLNEWLKNLVLKFRKEYQKLSEDEKKYISNLENLNPCLQIEVLLIRIKDKELQLLIFTHDDDLEDLYIKIHGSYDFDKELEKIKGFVLNKRFQRILEDRLEEEFIKLVKNIKSYKESKSPSQTLLGPKGEDHFLWIWVGKIQDHDINKFIKEIFEKQPKKLKETEIASKLHSNIFKTLINCYGVYAYPPIWIGEIPKLSFKDKLKDEHFQWLRNFIKVVVKYTYKGRKLAVESDGYLVIGESDRKVAKNLINEIFGSFLLKNNKLFSVKEYELAPTFLHPESGQIFQHAFSGKSIELAEKRRKPISKYFERDRLILEKDSFLNILDLAEKITQKEENSILLRILLDSFLT